MTIETTITTLLNDTHDTLLDSPLHKLPIKTTIEQHKNEVLVTLTSHFPIDWVHSSFIPNANKRLQEALPEFNVSVQCQVAIHSHQTQLVGKSLRGVKNVIAVASGKGGVGKSTVAVNLAVALARAGARVGVLDADIYGPSIPLMLGGKKEVVMKNDRYQPIEAYGIYAMSIGYLTEGEPALIWRGPMLAKSMLQMLDITAWDNLDYLFIDLPPGTGDIQLSLVQKIPLTGAVIVTTPQTIATLDAEKAMMMFNKTGIDVLGVIENMATHTCSQCGHEEAIFGHDGIEPLLKRYSCNRLGQIPLNTDIRIAADSGIPITTKNSPSSQAFLKAALYTAITIAKKPLNYADKFPPIHVEQ